ncbi:unnamed protein product [Prunus armeniaca]
MVPPTLGDLSHRPNDVKKKTHHCQLKKKTHHRQLKKKTHHLCNRDLCSMYIIKVILRSRAFAMGGLVFNS